LQLIPILKIYFEPGAVAHGCNLSHSGGRDQEDHSSKLVWANSLQNPVSKKPSQKRADRMAHGIDPEFKPQY
jgi:hypothetical protein